jgi:hypothetical protein
MQDLPDFENLGINSSSSMREYHSRPGLEPIPAFDVATSVTLQIEVLKETYDEIMRVLLENEWEREEGLRIMLLSGLGYLDAKERLAQINRAPGNADGESSRHLDTLVNDLASYHQQYSVMKFKAFKLYKVNQVLEFNISGLRETERMWEAWAARMRKQHSELQTEVIRLRALMSEFKLDWDAPLSREVEAGLAPVVAEPEPQSEQPTVKLETEPPILMYREETRQLTIWERIKRFFAADY